MVEVRLGQVEVMQGLVEGQVEVRLGLGGQVEGQVRSG